MGLITLLLLEELQVNLIKDPVKKHIAQRELNRRKKRVNKALGFR